ncbi:MAG: serine hydrolase [Chitinophagaceae bacterium]|nr:serine hydrolase [Chitinophagaceae bacterium]
MDARSHEPVAYATISNPVDGINTMSNEEGDFIFKIPTDGKSDSIYISHIGYMTLALPIKALDTTIRIIQLQEKVVQLSEVVVRHLDPLDLIRKAFARMPDNYPSRPYLLNGFYRMTGFKEKKIVDLSEAVFDIYCPDNERKNKQFRLIKARGDIDMVAFNGNEVPIGRKPERLLDFDMVSRIKETQILGEQGLNNHEFTYNGMIDYEGAEAYEIGFDQKVGVEQSLYKGSIFIDTKSLAFLGFNYGLSPRGLKYREMKEAEAAKKADKQSAFFSNLLSNTVIIKYRKYGNKYYLNHVYTTTHNHFYFLGKKPFDCNPLVLKTNLLITRIDTANAKSLQEGEKMKTTRLIESMIADNSYRKDNFWENYNLIEADFNVDSVTRVIRRNNASLDYKTQLEGKLSEYKKDKTAMIDSILSFYHQKDLFNGTALVKYQGSVIYEKAFGMADRANNIPNTVATQFRIGSATKQFTAMLIMQLVNENKLNVTDSIGKFLPGYVHGEVTIQQLLTHRSGIPNYTENRAYLAKVILQKYTLDELISRFCSDSLEFEPGTAFSYSNSGFVILADIIEKITGKPFGEVLAERIFSPAGMKHSFFGTVPHTAGIALGYVNDIQEHMYPLENVAGAGAITSTVEDLLLWDKALSAGALLPKDKTAELFRPRVEWNEWEAYYGYGWMIDRFLFKISQKHTVQYHPGTELGLYAMLVRQPDKDIFIILLNNTGDFPRFEMTDLILNGLNE